MRSPMLAIAALLGLASAASAGTISTSYLFEGGADSQNVCVAINVGKKPLTVTVEAVPFEGSGAFDTQTCTLVPLAAATSVPDADGDCETFTDSAGFCRFTVPGSTKGLRGVMINRLTAAPFTINAISEAR
jgi:hypothetical protein